MHGDDKNYPSWRYGPNGQSRVINSEDEEISGWKDHPSKVKDAAPAGGGQQTAVRSPNSTVSVEKAAKTTAATSPTITDPAKAAKSGVGGAGNTPATGNVPVTSNQDTKADLDAHGHPYDPELHAATKSKTKAGLWRLKVGATRPDPAPGYPLDL